MRKAFIVNLEERWFNPSSIKFSSQLKGSFEEDIYNSLPTKGKKRWATAFNKTLEKWQLFGFHGYTTDPLIIYGLHRIIEASGFRLHSDLHGKIPESRYSSDACMRDILKGIGIDFLRDDTRDRLYQSLLWFFGQYKSEATQAELDALKVRCAAEKPLPPGHKKDSLRVDSSQDTQPYEAYTSSFFVFDSSKFQDLSTTLNTSYTTVSSSSVKNRKASEFQSSKNSSYDLSRASGHQGQTTPAQNTSIQTSNVLENTSRPSKNVPFENKEGESPLPTFHRILC